MSVVTRVSSWLSLTHSRCPQNRRLCNCSHVLRFNPVHRLIVGRAGVSDVLQAKTDTFVKSTCLCCNDHSSDHNSMRRPVSNKAYLEKATPHLPSHNDSAICFSLSILSSLAINSCHFFNRSSPGFNPSEARMP